MKLQTFLLFGHSELNQTVLFRYEHVVNDIRKSILCTLNIINLWMNKCASINTYTTPLFINMYLHNKC